MGLIFVPKMSCWTNTYNHLLDISLIICTVTPYNEVEMTGHI